MAGDSEIVPDEVPPIDESSSVGLLSQDVMYANQEAVELEEIDAVTLGGSGGDPSSEKNTGSTERCVSSEGYGTFSVSPTSGKRVSMAQTLTLNQRRLLRSTQKRQYKELERGLKKRGQFALKFTAFVDNSMKRMNEIRRSYFRIWGTSIKEIEGNLGSGVSTYFKVLVWLLKINVLCMLLGIGLIVAPGWYMVTHHDDYTDDADYNRYDLECTNPNFVNGTGFHFDAVNSILQLLTGTGWMESTALFYGWYPTSNLTSNIKGKEKTIYFFSFAYFAVGCSYFIISLLLMASNLSRLFKKSAAEQIDTKPYSCLIFVGWDYTIHNEETSQLKSITIIKSLREELNEDAQGGLKRELSTEIGIFFLRILTNAICIAAMVGTVYLYVYQMLTDSTESRANSTNKCGQLIDEDAESALNLTDFTDLSELNLTENLAAFWKTYSAPIIVSGSNVVFPVFFQIVGDYEMYQFQSTRIGITLFRMFIMKLFSISTFLYILYTATRPSGGILDESWQTANNTLMYNCWEDYVASQLYQLIIIDFMIFCVALLCSEVLRSFLVTHVHFLRVKLGLTKPEFNIPKEILDLVYKQMIFWSGFFFAPLLPVVAVIEVIVIFYLKKHSGLRNVIPPQTVVLTSQSTSTVNALFLVSLLVVFVFIGLVIFNFVPSARCGPFRGYNRFTDPLSIVVDHSGFFKKYIIDNLKMTSVAIILVILVALVIYYYRSLAASRNVTIGLLKEQIKNEIADKHFLLERVQDSKVEEGKSSKKSARAGEGIKSKRKTLRRLNSRMHGFANANPSIL